MVFSESILKNDLPCYEKETYAKSLPTSVLLDTFAHWKQHLREDAAKNVSARTVIYFKSVKAETNLSTLLLLFYAYSVVNSLSVTCLVMCIQEYFKQADLVLKERLFLTFFFFFPMTFKSWINSCATARIVYMHMLSLETKGFTSFFFCSCYQMLHSVYMNKTFSFLKCFIEVS